jgi:hypothetical protein
MLLASQESRPPCIDETTAWIGDSDTNAVSSIYERSSIASLADPTYPVRLCYKMGLLDYALLGEYCRLVVTDECLGQSNSTTVDASSRLGAVSAS